MEEHMASVLEATQVVPGRDAKKEEAKRLAEDSRTKRARQMQGLNLQRENILSQRTSQPARRIALEAALAQIDGQLAQLS
jgi:hypothetical protein